MQQADDFLEESECLAAILETLDDEGFGRETLFKRWTIEDVLCHLHMFNHAANLSAESGEEFEAFFAPVAAQMRAGKTMREIQYGWLDGLGGHALFEAWRSGCKQTAARFRDIDPKARLIWAGPDMSARSSITARQMETWAHGQEIFDVLGQVRRDSDRIRNIAHLGVTTFGWTFINRGETVPDPAPFVTLTAPSGAIWEWNEPQVGNFVQGSASEFCQVVTQVRNVADTSLHASGAGAARWMTQAQCFAGSPEDPPPPGARHVANADQGGS